MLKVICVALLAALVSACSFNPVYYDELRQAEAQQNRMMGR
jgi:hypothetical protein